MEIEYLDSVKNQFKYYKSVGENSFDQLDEEDLFGQSNNDLTYTHDKVLFLVNCIFDHC